MCVDRMADEFKFMEEMSEEKLLELMNGVFLLSVGCMYGGIVHL